MLGAIVVQEDTGVRLGLSIIPKTEKSQKVYFRSGRIYVFYAYPDNHYDLDDS